MPTSPEPLLAKDDEELELERDIFGDQETYRRELHQFGAYSGQGDALPFPSPELKLKSYHLEQQVDFAAVEDSELFFLDAGPGTSSNTQPEALASQGAENATESHERPAWVDSDDERLTVSLATTNQLRKLRRYEAEDYINGTEYARRLCQQFEKLYPTPEWAIALRAKPGEAHRQKRRRLSDSTSSSDEAGSNHEDAGYDMSTRPLAQLLQNSSPLLEKSARKKNNRIAFRAEVLDIQRTKDVSGSQPSAITSLSFHPSLPLLLSSGPSGLLTLHHMAPAAPMPNPILTRVALRRLPVQTSVFHPSGTRAILTSQRRYYHIWDLESGRFQRVTSLSSHDKLQQTCDQFAASPCGRYLAFVGSGRKGGGSVNIVDAETGQWVCSGRVEGQGGVADLAWWRTGDGLCILGKGGEVLEYSVKDRRPLARWSDEGAIGSTKIALGDAGHGSKRNVGLGGYRFVAIGSSAGIVNLYDRATWTMTSTADSQQRTTIPERPLPKKTFDQLVTSISILEFSLDGQLLAMASREKKDALRLIHTASCSVYRNWPTSDTPLGRVASLAWGEMSEEGELLLAIANDQGKIRLWQVRG